MAPALVGYDCDRLLFSYWTQFEQRHCVGRPVNFKARARALRSPGDGSLEVTTVNWRPGAERANGRQHLHFKASSG